MTTRLIIARHGNTFTADQTPTRVGAKTDLPLVEHERGRNIGHYLLHMGIHVDAVMTGPLKRHSETAALVCEVLHFDVFDMQVRHDFNEIDYGPDEDKTEDEVMLRLGEGDMEKGRAVIDKWNADATVPAGWDVDVEGIKQAWRALGEALCESDSSYKDKTTLLVSSNGTMRFAPELTGDFAAFTKARDIKVATGGVCIFEKNDDEPYWRCVEWGVKPHKVLAQSLAP